MNVEEFVSNFADALRNTEGLDLGPGTRYRELAQWDSITAVSTVAMVISEYEVELSGEELRACETLGELCELVSGKVAAEAS